MPTLSWLGKKKIVNHHLDVPFHVLDKKYKFESKVECKNNSTDNRIIHGDNLAVLKSLLPEFEGKVDCIYIDPPYNTGNKKDNFWIYSDNVNDPRMKEWFGKIVGKDGEDLSRHDKWLCMMYPRLKLLNRLLAENGVIFISIDDNEQANLKLLCDEVFGQNGCLATFIWKNEGNFDNQAKIKIGHEYILGYMKKKDLLERPTIIDPSISQESKLFNDKIINTIIKNGNKNPVSSVTLPKGFPCNEESFEVTPRSDKYPIFTEEIIVRDYKTQKAYDVESGWSSKDLLIEFIENEFKPVLDSKGQSTTFHLTKNGAIESVKHREIGSHVISVLSGHGTTQSQRKELQTMGFDFPYPKPVDLVKYLISVATSKKDAIILDSFAGSGTTAHAVLKLNEEDNGFRQFILCELGEYAETITAERVRLAMDGYGEGKSKTDGLGGSFEFFELGEPLFLENELLNESIGIERIRQYVSYSERIPLEQQLPITNNISPTALGVNEQTLWLFNYDENAVTSLDLDFLGSLNLRELKQRPSQYVIYADKCVLETKFMQDHGITFKRIPRDILRF